MERRRELEQEQIAEKAKTTSAVAAGKGEFYLSSADRNFQLKFDGYLQARIAYLEIADRTDREFVPNRAKAAIGLSEVSRI